MKTYTMTLKEKGSKKKAVSTEFDANEIEDIYNEISDQECNIKERLAELIEDVGARPIEYTVWVNLAVTATNTTEAKKFALDALESEGWVDTITGEVEEV